MQDRVSLNINVKNISRLIVRVLEINTRNYYENHLSEIKGNLDLEGLCAHEETVVEYQSVLSHQRIQRTLNLPSLQNKRGVFVIEDLGGDKRCRALIRKGHIYHLTRQTIAGHCITLFDEKNLQPIGNSEGLSSVVVEQQANNESDNNKDKKNKSTNKSKSDEDESFVDVNDNDEKKSDEEKKSVGRGAAVVLGGKLYKANANGEILIPFAPAGTSGTKSMIICRDVDVVNVANPLRVIASLNHATENYSLADTKIHVDREMIVGKCTATVEATTAIRFPCACHQQN